MTATPNTNGQPYPHIFELRSVTLLDSPFKRAQDLNTKTLLQYDVERLLEPYRQEAGLPVVVPGFVNWEGLKGHVGGHYLSALAMTYASTGNDSILARLNYFVNSLQACQQAHDQKHAEWGKGYLGGVPDGRLIWSALKEGNFKPYQEAWVPWYNVHKIFAGLRDAWYYAGNQEAKQMFLKLCDWSLFVTAQLSAQQMQSMLDTEHGGMNEVLADAYQLTGDVKYLNGARRFSHQALLYPLSRNIDNLDNKHANTQVPKVIGFQRIAELSSDTLFERASQYFWESVATKRSLVFGGNSRREFFPQQDAYTDFLNDVEGPETCNSYNMLKLTAGIHRKNPSAHYLDFYERVLYNHILSSQHPVTGGYVYFTPARPRHYRV
ncbi:MAG TPA: glycoside hydrolase family 127 protein, partial [Cyclobacteriaceae bacterium]|nr:glycoside hydrolase family 127 protein [Cyclobacteriaceae bacterium]